MSITLSRRRTLAQHNIPLVCGRVPRTPQSEHRRNTISCWSAGVCSARCNPNTGATQYPVGLRACAAHATTRTLAQHNIPLVCGRSARHNPNTGATQYPVGLHACAAHAATRTLAQHNIALVCWRVKRTMQPEHWRNTISRWSAGAAHATTRTLAQHNILLVCGRSARHNPNTGATQYPVGLRACEAHDATRTLAQHNIPLVCGCVPTALQCTMQPEHWRNTISRWSAGVCHARHNPNTGATQYPVGLRACAAHAATRTLAQHNIPLVCRHVQCTPQPEHWRNTISRWSAGVCRAIRYPRAVSTLQC